MNKEQNHGIQTSKIYWNVQEAQGIQTQKTLGIPIQEMFYYKDTQQTTNGRSNGWRTNTAEDDEHNETGQVKVSTRHRTASKSSRK